MMRLSIFTLALVVGAWSNPINNKVEDCQLSDELAAEIASYAPIVLQILDAAVNGSFKGVTYDELTLFIDKFGNRIAGSENLENAIDYMIAKSESVGLENVHGEDVQVPRWIRGAESATLLEPRRKDLYILGLGGSIATPPEGIEAEVLVVKSFNDLATQAEQANGKIVVFNEEFVSYGETVAYRVQGASAAAAVGAVAALVRSVGPFSLNTPHTGMLEYAEGVPQIPSASVTIEDAHWLQRLQDEGNTIRINLKMEAHYLPDVTSRNTVAEIQGSTDPEKVVIVSGHIDSWDVGQGAMDDGGGFFISWGSLALLNSLGLRAKRTIRAIFWTAEELGYEGAYAYADAHADETDNFMFMMESDDGTFQPVGLEYAGGSDGACIVQAVLNLLSPINATTLRQASSAVGSDIEVWTGDGIPGASLDNENDRYFWYHHSEADTMDAEDTDALDKNSALFAAVAYVLADLSTDFPRSTHDSKN